jgi:hypothetical protein
MEYSTITVSKEITASVSGTKRYRLKAWVQSTTNNIPGEIFVYQRIPAVPEFNEGADYDKFVHVASYADLIAFPKESPGFDAPYFRLYYIDLVHDTKQYLEDTWVLIEQQIQMVVKDITRINNLPPGQLTTTPIQDNCI